MPEDRQSLFSGAIRPTKPYYTSLLSDNSYILEDPENNFERIFNPEYINAQKQKHIVPNSSRICPRCRGADGNAADNCVGFNVGIDDDWSLDSGWLRRKDVKYNANGNSQQAYHLKELGILNEDDFEKKSGSSYTISPEVVKENDPSKFFTHPEKAEFVKYNEKLPKTHKKYAVLLYHDLTGDAYHVKDEKLGYTNVITGSDQYAASDFWDTNEKAMKFLYDSGVDIFFVLPESDENNKIEDSHVFPEHIKEKLIWEFNVNFIYYPIARFFNKLDSSFFTPHSDKFHRKGTFPKGHKQHLRMSVFDLALSYDSVMYFDMDFFVSNPGRLVYFLKRVGDDYEKSKTSKLFLLNDNRSIVMTAVIVVSKILSFP